MMLAFNDKYCLATATAKVCVSCMNGEGQSSRTSVRDIVFTFVFYFLRHEEL